MPDPSREPIRIAWGELLIALAVLAAAGIVAWQVTQIRVSPIYARVGPTLAPTLAWIGLGALGLGLLYRALRGGWQPDEEKESVPDFQALAWVGIGLIANVALIRPAGFILSSVVLFVCIARGFGSRRLLRDAGIALIFASLAYFGFAYALGIDIGRGPPEDFLLSILRR
jgi:putative tricarboxylic transport membrane protein